MNEKGKDKKGGFSFERRAGKDRRTGQFDEKYRHSVQAGFFLDMRKGNRRKDIEDNLISLN